MNNGPIFNKRSVRITLVAEILLLKLLEKVSMCFQNLYKKFQRGYYIFLSKLCHLVGSQCLSNIRFE